MENQEMNIKIWKKWWIYYIPSRGGTKPGTFQPRFELRKHKSNCDAMSDQVDPTSATGYFSAIKHRFPTICKPNSSTVLRSRYKTEEHSRRLRAKIHCSSAKWTLAEHLNIITIFWNKFLFLFSSDYHAPAFKFSDPQQNFGQTGSSQMDFESLKHRLRFSGLPNFPKVQILIAKFHIFHFPQMTRSYPKIISIFHLHFSKWPKLNTNFKDSHWMRSKAPVLRISVFGTAGCSRIRQTKNFPSSLRSGW